MTDPLQDKNQTRAWIEIDLGAVKNNIRTVLDILNVHKKPSNLMAVVKCNAYGHGLIPTAISAIDSGAAWLGVATMDEAEALRAANIAAPLFLTCVPTPQDAPDILRLNITVLLGDYVLLDALSRVQKPGMAASVHLDIDTGMGRSGVLPGQAVDLWRKAKSAGLNISGLFTHFADSEHPDSLIHLKQTALFQSTLSELQSAGAEFEWIHSSNSADIFSESKLPANLVRPGLLVYGISPFTKEAAQQHPSLKKLKPALALKAKIAEIRELPTGHTISYGATCTLTRPTRAATVLIGYGDGYPRRLSNCGDMLISGQRARILGRVCMDQTVVDVTDITNAQAGDEAVCIGQSGSESILIEDVAALIETTAHEIPVSLTSRLPRVNVFPG